jgi:putative phage-type endonuclease
MIPTIVIPENREAWLQLRSPNINSTEVGSLFGISKYATIFEIWHYKNKSIEIDFEGNERTEWGLALQDSIAAKVAKDNGWSIRRMDEYMFLPEIRLGSSFDFAIGDDGIMEIKNIDKFVYMDEWTDGNAPLHIECQVQTQLAVSGRKYCMIVGLIGGNEAVIIRRDRDEAVIQAIIEKTKWFWQTIADKKEPEPDFKKDAEIIGRLYGYAEPEKVIEGTDEIKTLAVKYKEVSDQIKPLEEQKEALKAEILTLVKDAEKVTGEGFTISAGMQGPKMIEAYERKGYRMFRVNWSKKK